MGYAPLEKTLPLELACNEILQGIIDGKITKENIDKEKVRIARKYSIGKMLKNAEIFQFVDKGDNNHELLKEFFKIKPIRTLSGVANIAVMWLDKEHRDSRSDRYYSCPGTCIYCTQGENAPKSYSGSEPTTMRAIRNNYDPFLQVSNRMKQLHIIGHSTDKCELIIMGGTFTSMPFDYQGRFVKGCLDAMSEAASESLEEAQMRNETAKNRCTGLTIETRADFCRHQHVDGMLKLGCTRVEIGIQSTSDKALKAIQRGHDSGENVRAIALLRNSGLKFTAHWMPGLTGLFGEIDIDEEIRLFRELFNNPDYRPDEIKVYPVLVLPNTGLHELWKNGQYTPLTKIQMLDLLIEMKKIVPSYVRIKRVMRDISEHESQAGASTTNLRQLAKLKMQELGINCNCIRCREIGLQDKKPQDVDMIVNEYEASEGKEFFISYEDVKQNMLLGFIRLRIINGDAAPSAFVRELHVYGEMTPIGEASRQAQHMGLGRNLLKKAEEIARSFGITKLSVTSGVGVREYYKKAGYKLEGYYMVKELV